MCQANGCQAMFDEQKEVNGQACICHPVEVVGVMMGTSAGPGAAASGAVHCATGQVPWQPGKSVITTVGGRTGLDGTLSLPCLAPGCPRELKSLTR